MEKQEKPVTIKYPAKMKEKLAEMAKETGVNQSALIKLATQSLLINYEKKGSFIFADLLNPQHKEE